MSNELDELRAKGKVLLDAAYDYWKAAQKAGIGGAIAWLDDDSGRTVIFTRGEYRGVLLQNVDKLRLEGAALSTLNLNLNPNDIGYDR